LGCNRIYYTDSGISKNNDRMLPPFATGEAVANGCETNQHSRNFKQSTEGNTMKFSALIAAVLLALSLSACGKAAAPAAPAAEAPAAASAPAAAPAASEPAAAAPAAK
jgi:hypothetical protein